MLKTTTLTLPGRDYTEPLTLTELPALVADRYARTALSAIGERPDGGVVALALQHLPAVMALGEQALSLLQPFVQASRPVRGWQNVLAVQQAALALHVSFLVGRPVLDLPVDFTAACIKQHGGDDLLVHFCSPHISTVLHSGRATYRELETVLSTEDTFNLVELLNVEAVRDWRAHQNAGARNP